MQPLYKRLLLTLFPDEMKHADISPATMFISSLSAKEFFSLLSRKVTEYYKINGFDTGIETFEAKIGIGKEQGIDLNNANNYYGYLIAAQYSGKGFFSPAFVSTHTALYSATLLAPYFHDHGEEYMIQSMILIYILPFLFITHIKNFPQTLSTKDHYNRFVKLCVSTLHLLGAEDDMARTIILVLNQESSVLRNLHVICQRAEQMFPLHNHITDHWNRILDEHLFNHKEDPISSFLKTYESSRYTHSYTPTEEEVAHLLLPHDFSITSLHGQVNIFDIIQHIITPWYASSDSLAEDWLALTHNEVLWPSLLEHRSTITHAKNSFRGGVQQFIHYQRSTQHLDTHEDIDEFMSAIEDGHDIDPDLVPESIKVESRIIDQIVHFYIGMIGGHRNAKNDNFWYRWTSQIPHITHNRQALHHTDHTYRDKHFALYDTNGFYYQRAWDHIRQGKQRFHIPLHATLRYQTNNPHTQDAVITSAVLHLLNDTHHTRMKITLHQQDIVDIFEKTYVKRIRQCIKAIKKNPDAHRRLIDDFTGGKHTPSLTLIAKDDDISGAMIDNLYRLDWQVWYDTIDAIVQDENTLTLMQSFYTDTTLLIVLSEIKKTLLGFMLWMRHEQTHHTSDGSALLLLYLRDILHLDERLRNPLQEILHQQIRHHKKLLNLRIQIDDNPVFLTMCSEMFHDFLAMEDYDIITEDILWLHSTLHHISSYNIRYVLPD